MRLRALHGVSVLRAGAARSSAYCGCTYHGRRCKRRCSGRCSTPRHSPALECGRRAVCSSTARPAARRHSLPRRAPPPPPFPFPTPPPPPPLPPPAPRSSVAAAHACSPRLRAHALRCQALAGEARTNFIAVKGPELFSKYVGESEQKVASLFAKVGGIYAHTQGIDTTTPQPAHRRGMALPPCWFSFAFLLPPSHLVRHPGARGLACHHLF